MSQQLIDSFQRPIHYLRLSVMDKCDLRCFYCLPKQYSDFVIPEHWLTFDEIERVAAAFSELGVNRIRITGGEPLLRKDLPLLVSKLNELDGIDDLSLSTNGVQLKRQAFALKQSGIGRINVSLDTLDVHRYKEITGGHLNKVIDGLTEASKAGLHPVKINMVVMKDINNHEISDMVEFCIEHGFTLRLIETMPLGDTGRDASEHYVNLQEVRNQLAQQFELVDSVMPGGGPARYVRVVGTDLRIGFITPISQHFCETCNRVRLSADGTLYLCLGQEDKVELRPLLRQGINDDELKDVIKDAVKRKPERHEFRERPGQLVRFMSRTGG